MIRIQPMIMSTIKAILCGSVGALLALLTVFVIYMNGRPDLEIWHTVELDEEFNKESPIESFADYLSLEERLFAQLEAKVYAHQDNAKKSMLNRYHRNSLADPERWSPNWNRSFLLKAEQPKALVLMLHGLSDAPYRGTRDFPSKNDTSFQIARPLRGTEEYYFS